MLAKHVERWKALGPRAALGYYLGTALLERTGVEIVRVFAWDVTGAGPAAAAADPGHFEILDQPDQLRAADRAQLDAYGGAPLWHTFEEAFAARWRCVIARGDDGALACVCWLSSTSAYEPSNGKRCYEIKRCFTLPAQRGRGHYQRTLRHAAATAARADAGTPILIESSVWNASSLRGIENAGFAPIGERVQVGTSSLFFPAGAGGARPWRQLIKRGLERALPERLLMTHAPATSGAVHLTFDDGPHPEHTPALLDALRKHQVHATFFVIGANAARHPELVRRMVAEGHAVGGHSFTHADPAGVSAAALMEEVDRTRALLAPLVGAPPTLFRPPLGAVTAAKLARLWAAGQKVVLWNVDPRDYALERPEELTAWFDAYPLAAGDVVLLHDTAPHASAALPGLVAAVRARGLAFATVDPG